MSRNRKLLAFVRGGCYFLSKHASPFNHGKPHSFWCWRKSWRIFRNRGIQSLIIHENSDKCFWLRREGKRSKLIHYRSSMKTNLIIRLVLHTREPELKEVCSLFLIK